VNREEYLEKALIELTPYIDKAGYSMPAVKVSAGWPSAKAFSSKARRTGETWHKDSVAQENSHIFISPYISDSREVLSILVHELGHAILKQGVGHRKPFKDYMRAVDLVGKATATESGEVLLSFLDLAIEKLGAYPHESIDKNPDRKKQSTRLRLYQCQCEDPVKIRAATDNLRATCLDCEAGFEKVEK